MSHHHARMSTVLCGEVYAFVVNVFVPAYIVLFKACKIIFIRELVLGTQSPTYRCVGIICRVGRVGDKSPTSVQPNSRDVTQVSLDQKAKRSGTSIPVAMNAGTHTGAVRPGQPGRTNTYPINRLFFKGFQRTAIQCNDERFKEVF